MDAGAKCRFPGCRPRDRPRKRSTPCCRCTGSFPPACLSARRGRPPGPRPGRSRRSPTVGAVRAGLDHHWDRSCSRLRWTLWRLAVGEALDDVDFLRRRAAIELLAEASPLADELGVVDTLTGGAELDWDRLAQRRPDPAAEPPPCYDKKRIPEAIVVPRRRYPPNSGTCRLGATDVREP